MKLQIIKIQKVQSLLLNKIMQFVLNYAKSPGSHNKSFPRHLQMCNNISAVGLSGCSLQNINISHVTHCSTAAGGTDALQ